MNFSSAIRWAAANASKAPTFNPIFPRFVAGFQDNRLFGNIVEAWEKREVSKIVNQRNPDHFEDFNVGDVVAVRSINPYHPNKLVTFCGICLGINNGLMGKSFIVRNNIEGVGVEQRFAFYSPLLKGVQVVRKPSKRVRQRKLYHLRLKKTGETTISVSEAELTRLPKKF